MKDLEQLAADTVGRLIFRLGINMTPEQQVHAKSLLWSEFDDVRTEAMDAAAKIVLKD